MTKNVIPVRVTKKEYDWIQNYRSFHNIENNNQLFRQAIEKLMGVRLADRYRNPPTLPPEYMMAYRYHEKLLGEFSKNPRTKGRIKKIFHQWKTNFFGVWIPEYNKKLDRSNLMLDSFDKHQPRGRPEKPKKSRGRPDEKGFGED